MQFGKVGINPESFKDSTFEEFKALLGGKIQGDISEVWKKVCEYNKKIEDRPLDKVEKIHKHYKNKGKKPQ